MNYWIVVVDDEAMSLTNARNLLSGQEMRVSCLRSGRDLLKFMGKNEPDLILLDVMMPEMDGFETFSALRALEEEQGKKRTPVIFLTGSEDSETERRGLKLGASDFIRKPFQKDVLLSRIHNAVANTRTIESLTEEATIDRLTGFLNKAAGTTRVAKLCAGRSGSLMVLDLDNFKLVNDLYGHDMGDRVLKAFAHVLRQNTRDDDTIARIGGDEFLAFFGGMKMEETIASLTRRLNEQLFHEAVALMGESFDIPLGISVGAVMAPECGQSYDTLFPLADSALYTAKHNGKHGYYLYRSGAEETLSHEEDLQAELSRLTRIIEERNEAGGALLLGMEPFSFVYRFIKRFASRYGGKMARLLFVLGTEDDEQRLRKATEQFLEVLQKTLRRSDVILQSRPNQFFLLLPEQSEEDVPDVVGRIMAAWEKTEGHDRVRIGHAVEYTEYEKKDPGNAGQG
ncbi:MAG: diguanylate cyclase [Schwartzia sp.]|nr:diguanylate cyclase [Schwartzia sp. (in: firmicutes)]